MSLAKVLDMEMAEEKKVLTVDDIRFGGTGGMDVEGEWNWSGNYEMELSRRWTASNFNFYATISRSRSRRGSTTGWYVTLFLSMFYRNGRDIKLLNQKFRTLKAAKQGIFEKIQEVHEDVSGTEQMIQAWKKSHAQPVFGLDKETGKPILLGTAYISASVEMETEKEELWFNDDIPNYKDHRLLYELNISYHKPVHFYASKIERTWGGYCGSTEQDKSIVEEMVKLVENNEKYAWLFERMLKEIDQ